jgi:hypothetical protein
MILAVLGKKLEGAFKSLVGLQRPLEGEIAELRVEAIGLARDIAGGVRIRIGDQAQPI